MVRQLRVRHDPDRYLAFPLRGKTRGFVRAFLFHREIHGKQYLSPRGRKNKNPKREEEVHHGI